VTADVTAGLATVALYALPLLGAATVCVAAYWLGYRRGYFLGDRDRARRNVREACEAVTAARLGELVPGQREASP
jgi:hypothetical protein